MALDSVDLASDVLGFTGRSDDMQWSRLERWTSPSTEGLTAGLRGDAPSSL